MHDVAELLDHIKAAGITLTYSSEGDKLIARPTSAVTQEMVASLREHRGAVISALCSGTIQSEAELRNMVWEVFPDRENLPVPPPIPGRDPLVHCGTDKARFFRGNWREAWPRDFERRICVRA